MSVTVESLRRSGRYPLHRPTEATILRPTSLPELRKCLVASSPYARPFRPRGAGSASTDCTTAALGTVIDMTAFDQILNIDAYNDTVIVQAGVRIGQLGRALAVHGLELAGSHDLLNRTVGGAIAGGCIGPAIANDGAYFATQVQSVKLVTADGRLLQVSQAQKNLLNAVRLSYGMLGVIYEDITRALRITWGRNILPEPKRSPTAVMPSMSGPSMTLGDPTLREGREAVRLDVVCDPVHEGVAQTRPRPARRRQALSVVPPRSSVPMGPVGDREQALGRVAPAGSGSRPPPRRAAPRDLLVDAGAGPR